MYIYNYIFNIFKCVGEAGLQATLIEKDRLLVSLKRMVDDLEQKYVEVNALLQESHAELLSEKDVNFLLRDLIGKIENKAAQEIKDERERLLDQMEAVSVDLRAKSDDLNAFRAKNDSLQAQLESTLLQLTESTSEYEKKRFLLVQELDEVKVFTYNLFTLTCILNYFIFIGATRVIRWSRICKNE